MIWIHFNHSIDVIFILKVVRVVNHVPLVSLYIRAIKGIPQPYVSGLEQRYGTPVPLIYKSAKYHPFWLKF